MLLHFGTKCFELGVLSINTQALHELLHKLFASMNFEHSDGRAQSAAQPLNSHPMSKFAMPGLILLTARLLVALR